VRGRNSADTWREASRWATKGASASGGEVQVSALCSLGCLSFPDEERSDEVSMPDTAPEIIRQPERLECVNDIRQPATFDACAV